MKTLSLATAAAAAALALAGCGTAPSAAPTPATSTPATTPTTPTSTPSTTPSETASASPSSGTPSSSSSGSSSSSASSSSASSSSSSASSARPSDSGSTGSTTEPGQSSVNGTVVTFPPPGIELRTESDINALVGASSDLKKFLVSEMARVRAKDSGGCTSFLTMDALRVPDLASGGISGCGGAAVLWGRVNGTWKIVADGQDAPQCAVIRNAGLRVAIPAGFYGSQCLEAGKLETYKP